MSTTQSEIDFESLVCHEDSEAVFKEIQHYNEQEKKHEDESTQDLQHIIKHAQSRLEFYQSLIKELNEKKGTALEKLINFVISDSEIDYNSINCLEKALNICQEHKIVHVQNIYEAKQKLKCQSKSHGASLQKKATTPPKITVTNLTTRYAYFSSCNQNPFAYIPPGHKAVVENNPLEWSPNGKRVMDRVSSLTLEEINPKKIRKSYF